MQLSTIAIATEALVTARVSHAMAPTTFGLILICGGLSASGTALATAELYNPATGASVATGPMTTPRYGHTATLLLDGRILVTGGQTTGGGYLATAEYFYCVDARSGRSAFNGAFVAAVTGLSAARAGHTAVMLFNGLLFVAGGANSGNAALSLDELYVPAIIPTETVGVSPF
jgi:hypothetical protein